MSHVPLVTRDLRSVGEGENVELYAISGNDSGSMLTISRGTTASPDTTAKAVVKINRLHEVPDAAFGASPTDAGEELAALVAVSQSTASGTNQPVGVVGIAKASGTGAGTGARSPDATGGYFRGWIEGSGIGRGIGAFAQGYSEGTSGYADGIQLVSNNNGSADHTVASAAIAGSTGAWICAGGDYRSGVGVQVGNGFGFQFDVGFHVNGQVTAYGSAITVVTSAEADDIIDTSAAHGLSAGQQVRFTALTGGTGLAISTTYYVIAANLAATTFQLSATSGGAAINFTTDITAGTVYTVRTGAAYTAAYRDDSDATYGVQIRGTHTAAITTHEATGPALWLANSGSGATNGSIVATNIAANGTRTLLYYNSSGNLMLGTGVENVIYSSKYHSFGAGIGLDAMNIATDTTTGTKIGTGTTQKLGFWNATPVVKGTVTGSRGGNAALASLLTLLASYGLLTDSSS